MPHLILEYANNLDDSELNVPDLLELLTRTAIETGIFPEAGLRARAYRANHQRVASGDSDLAFIHLSMNVGKGRELSIRQQAGETLFDALKAYLAPLMTRRSISLSFEMREIDDVKFNDRNF